MSTETRTPAEMVMRMATSDLLVISRHPLAGKMEPALQQAARAELRYRMELTHRRSIVDWSSRESESGLSYIYTLADDGELVISHGISTRRLDIEVGKELGRQKRKAII